jgi:hypothetical protein
VAARNSEEEESEMYTVFYLERFFGFDIHVSRLAKKRSFAF